MSHEPDPSLQNQIKPLGYEVPEGTPPPQKAFAETVAAFHDKPAIPLAEAEVPEGYKLPTNFTPTHVRVMQDAKSPDGFKATCVSFLGGLGGLQEDTRFNITGIQIPNGPLVDMAIHRTTQVIEASAEPTSSTIADGLNDARRDFAPVAILGFDAPPAGRDTMQITPGPHGKIIDYADHYKNLGFHYAPTGEIPGKPGEPPGRTFEERVIGTMGEQLAHLSGTTLVTVTRR
jgi:hypothetical protein